ncbi:MAG: 2,3-bisphosphoglycerate-independent phosphoglycerate mutase [Patescibacteria group bacterium]|nr:2,3-bisphosphoglycerate-independent phosphoglycerate mutase [Patescibacteria group bacterium]
MAFKYKPVVLIILDGWGVAPDSDGNAITRANTPNLDNYAKNYPVMTLTASGNEVGLSFGEMGNSEVGHLNLGAGRVYYQTLPRIDQEMASGAFANNQALLSAMEHAKKNNSNLHLMGLVSSGKVHASNEHLFKLLELAKKNGLTKNVYVHAFLDGRDTIYNSGKFFIEELLGKMKEMKAGKLASLSGRYWAMDRDNHWDRIEKVYRLLVEGEAERTADDPLKAIDGAYANKNYDEEFLPTAIIDKKGQPVATIKDNDAVIFFNFRPDRARELTKAFVLPEFAKFSRRHLANLCFVTLAEYEKDLPATVAYPPVLILNSLAETVSRAGLKQFHLAETEKYAHITFFLNGTREEPFPGEDRKIVPSPKVASYDNQPEMSAPEVTKEAIKAIESDRYAWLAINFANGDMVGHTGNIEATIKACEAADKCVGEIVDHVLAKNGAVVITSDHGNAEEVKNLETGDIDKEHSNNPVPLYIISHDLMGQAGPSGDPPEGDLSLVQPVGMLADVAPTILNLLGLEKPPEMSGRSLV